MKLFKTVMDFKDSTYLVTKQSLIKDLRLVFFFDHGYKNIRKYVDGEGKEKACFIIASYLGKQLSKSIKTIKVIWDAMVVKTLLRMSGIWGKRGTEKISIYINFDIQNNSRVFWEGEKRFSRSSFLLRHLTTIIDHF